jgi:hypothetical protein
MIVGDESERSHDGGRRSEEIGVRGFQEAIGCQDKHSSYRSRAGIVRIGGIHNLIIPEISRSIERTKRIRKIFSWIQTMKSPFSNAE